MAEWFKAPVLKTGVPQGTREFESRPFRFHLAEVPIKSGRKRASPLFSSASAWCRRSYAKARETKSAAFHLDKTSVKSVIIISMYYVYLLKCFDNRTYIGCTDNLKDRMNRHQKGQIPAT